MPRCKLRRAGRIVEVLANSSEYQWRESSLSITPAPGLVSSEGGGIRLLPSSAAQGDKRLFSAAASRQLVHRRRLVTAEQITDSRRAWFFHRRWAMLEFGVNSTSAFMAGPGAGNVLNGFVGSDDAGHGRRKCFTDLVPALRQFQRAIRAVVLISPFR